MERAPGCWRLKCPDEVRYFIRILLCTLQHTIVAVTANGQGPGRKIKDDWGGKSERESPNHSKIAGLGAAVAPAACSLSCSDSGSQPRAQTLC